MSSQPSECTTYEHDEKTRESFVVSVDLGTLGACADNVPPTIETLRAITIRATECATLREWSASLEQCARELADAPTDKHSLFTRKNVMRAIKQLVARKQGIKVTPVQDSRVMIIFELSVQSDILPDIIMDKLALTLEPIAQTSDDLRIKQLIKRAEEQDAEIARLARIIVTHGEFAREIAINTRVTQIAALYGPLSRCSFALAQRVTAAEVDGDPIVFRELGCDAPIWLYSVIRFANVSKPCSDKSMAYAAIHDAKKSVGEIGYHYGPEFGSNEMSSGPLNLSDWIEARSRDCVCNILIILRVQEDCGAQLSPIHVRSSTGFRPYGECEPLKTKVKCTSKTVIFGNPFDHSESSQRCDAENTGLRAYLDQWLAKCANIHTARLTFTEAQARATGASMEARECMCASYPGEFIYQYSEEVARAYEAAEDANICLDIVQKKWIYPTRIVSISRNLAHI